MRRNRFALGAAGLAVGFAAVVAAFYVNEARKEVVYLCANFEPGVPRASVVRQLDTGHFLRYREDGERLVADTAYTFGTVRCIVDFDADGRVAAAGLD